MSSWKFLLPLALISAACGSSTTDDASTGGSAGQTSSGGSAGSGGSSTGGTAGAGNADSGVGGTTDGGKTCAEISLQFDAALQKAKECSLFPGLSKCDLLVKKDLECGEYEFVDSSNTEVIAELKALQDAWDAASCDAPGSCGLGGYSATSATCAGGGQGGDVGVCVSKM